MHTCRRDRGRSDYSPRVNELVHFGRVHGRYAMWSSRRPSVSAMFDLDVICQAIRARRLLAFKYGGFHRIVAPYCHGASQRDREVLRGVQIGGLSRSFVSTVVCRRLLPDRSRSVAFKKNVVR